MPDAFELARLVKKCQSCGREIKKSSHRCPHCNANLAELELQEWYQSLPSEAVRRKVALQTPRNKSFLILSTALAFSAVVTLAIYRFSSVSEGTPREPAHAANTSINLTRNHLSATQTANDISMLIDQVRDPGHETQPSIQTNSLAVGQSTPQANMTQPSEQSKAREEEIQRYFKVVYDELHEKQPIITATLYLKSGSEIKCCILEESEQDLKIRRQGINAVIKKDLIARIERKPPEVVARESEELRLEALLLATRIVDEGLVLYRGDWISPQERAQRLQLEKIENERRRIEAQREAAIARSDAALQEQYNREYLRAKTERDKIAFERERLRGGVEVPVVVTPPPRKVLVPVTITGPKYNTTTLLTLDTGATSTMITKDVSKRLQLVPHDLEQIKIADGSTVVSAVVLVNLTVGGCTVKNLEVSVLSRSQDYGNGLVVEGLLGMDFLGHFQPEIDMERHILILRPKRQQ